MSPPRLLLLISFVFLQCSFEVAAAPVHDAVQAGDMAKVRALVEADPAQATFKDAQGRTPLHLAAEGVRRCLDLDKESNDAAPPAKLDDYTAIAHFLISKGADLNAPDAQGRFPLGEAATNRTGAAALQPTPAPITNVWSTLQAQPAIAAHQNAIGAIAFSPDGTVIASSSWKQNASSPVGEIAFWDAQSNRLLRRIEGHWQTPWKGVGPKPTWVGHWGKINALVFAPDGIALASGGEDGRVRLWDQDGHVLQSLEGFQRPVVALGWASPTLLMGVSRDGATASWNVATGTRRTSRLANSHSGDWVRSCAFSPDGRRFAVGDSIGVLSVWQASGELVTQFYNSRYQESDKPMGVEVTALAFSPDGKLLVSANHAHLYANSLDKPEGASVPRLHFAGQRILRIAFAPDGSALAAVGHTKILLLDPNSKSEKALPLSELTSGSQSASGAVFSPLRNSIAIATESGSIMEWSF